MCNKLFNVALLFLTIFLTACQATNSKPRPAWINEPGEGAVGSATTHVRGRHFQEELAIARARERLAARLGVEVNSVQTIKEKVVNEKAYVTSTKQTFQEVNKKTVKAHVREIWHDKGRDELWAWVYPVQL